MLNLLLDLSRVEAGRLDLVREPVDLVNIVQRVVSTVQSLTTKHTITAEAPRSLIGVWDGARLYQVLQNLLTNAVKYSPDGGTISVSVGGDTTAATVSVRDPGLGIPPEDLPHLFERFYRVSGTRKLEGSGLGLYISHGIIAGHGGRLWAESAGPRNGSVFTFSLPY
ncbi:MAG TPA: ATP-binding protein, partial [Chloroflexota bacterium]|nr:ATP-binding protein [Chloroflexota bacterium]